MFYILRMIEEDSIVDHINTFNIVDSQLVLIDIKMSEKEKCITFLYFFLDS